jgi:hypothetical protein
MAKFAVALAVVAVSAFVGMFVGGGPYRDPETGETVLRHSPVYRGFAMFTLLLGCGGEIVGLMAVLGGDVPKEHHLSAFILPGIFIVLGVYLWGEMFLTEVRLGQEGLTSNRFLHSEVHIPWNNVRELRRLGTEFEVRGYGVGFKVSMSIPGRDLLLTELRKRRPDQTFRI